MNHPAQRRGSSRRCGAAALAAALSVAAAPQVAAAPAPSPVAADNIARLNSCIAQKKSADLMFVVDESQSLSGFEDLPATDPDAVRVAAAQDLIRQLGIAAQDVDADINVKLAGFGETYESDPDSYGDWANVANQADALASTAEIFAERDQQSYTDYGTALRGAGADMAAHSDGDSCRAVLFFTDGLITTPGEEAAAATDQLCSAAGPVNQLRQSGVQLFTVGLIPRGTDSPEQLLRDMAETPDCGEAPANGAFFNATDDVAGLFSAFRGILPNAGSVQDELRMGETFRFVLDNSVDEIRLDAQPQQRGASENVQPYLINPRGDRIDLGGSGTQDLAGAEVEVLGDNQVLPGMIDAELRQNGSDAWAGEWTFGYDSPEKEGRYKIKMQILPGLHLDIPALSEGEKTGITNEEPLQVQLLNRDGEAVDLEGEAELEAMFVAADGAAPLPLGEAQSIAEGSPVAVPLDAIDRPVNGTIALRSQITTKGTDDAPGTALSPIVAEYPVSISPRNMPVVPGEVQVTVEETHAQFTVPITGPGEAMLGGAVLNAVPEGAEGVSVQVDEAPLQLAKGEEGTLSFTIDSEHLADGPLAGVLQLNLASADGDGRTAEVDIPLSGSMRAPVNTTVFSLVMVVALLLGLLIPLAILYLFKYLSGTLTRKKIYALTIPVQIKEHQVIRSNTGRPFHVDRGELMDSTGTMVSGRHATIGSKSFGVALGLNPFSSAQARAQQAPSIPDDGRRSGDNAVLPLDLAQHWVFYPQQGRPEAGVVVVLVDRFATDDAVARIERSVREKLPRLAQDLHTTAKDSGEKTASDSSGGSGAAETAAAGSAASSWGGPSEPRNTGWDSGGHEDQKPHRPSSSGWDQPRNTGWDSDGHEAQKPHRPSAGGWSDDSRGWDS